MLEEDGDLREIDPGDAVLLGERAERVDLLDRPVVDELRRERRGRPRSLLRSQGRVELLLRHELALEQDLAERSLLVAGGHGSSTVLTVRGRRIGHNARLNALPGSRACRHPRIFERPRRSLRSSRAPARQFAERAEDAARPGLEAPGVDRRARPRHELPVPVQVVERQEAQAQDLAGE